MARMGRGREGHPLGGGLLLPVQPWGLPEAAGGMGIKSRRENILQQVQPAPGLNGCQPARKSQTHLCSSVGHQMGPGLVFWAGVVGGGWARLEGGLAAPARDAHTPPAFPHIYPGIFSLFYQLEVGPLLGSGAGWGYTRAHSQAPQLSESWLCPQLLLQTPRDTHPPPGTPIGWELHSPACLKGAEHYQLSLFSSAAAHLIPQCIRTIPAPRASHLHPGVLPSLAPGWHRGGWILPGWWLQTLLKTNGAGASPAAQLCSPQLCSPQLHPSHLHPPQLHPSHLHLSHLHPSQPRGMRAGALGCSLWQQLQLCSLPAPGYF